ncbi:MAG: undecaprenyl diphosphate synthase family protein [Lachnospiraceae bacterium]|nr:undecaprenyl diphosphate synthase family protein [Lachnospiraceae bacterium]
MSYSKLNHIGIIPDGNRRWAVRQGMRKEEGYMNGLIPGLMLVKKAKQLKVKEITFYGFTVDNCKRPKEQVEAFKKACVKAVELIANEGADLLVVGNTESKCFPNELNKYTKRTRINGGGIKINFLVDYGWRWDLSQIKEDGQPHSADISRIDLIIRWGGMRRLSGFLPIQSVYSDFYVVDSFWPDYKNSDLEDAIRWYGKQEITLGG